MKKLTALFVLTVLTALLFTGCKANDNPPAPNAPETTVQAVQAQQAPEEALPEETAVNKNKPTNPNNNKPNADVKPTESAVKPTDPPVAQDFKLSKDDVKKAVLEHAGLNKNEVTRFRAELDRERGGLVYEVEFDAGKYEYEYEVDANNGNILKAEKEFRD